MARLARVIALDVPHHVTQRGNARRYILDSDSDRLVYLDLLRHSCQLYKLSLLGYCLMSNHVHLVVTPRSTDSLALALKGLAVSAFVGVVAGIIPALRAARAEIVVALR